MPILKMSVCSAWNSRNVQVPPANVPGTSWPTHNITLFHYRNHGAAEGRVLVGLEAEDAQQNPDGLIETLESILSI